MTDEQILEATYQQAKLDAEAEHPGASLKAPSLRASSVDGNRVTLRNGAGMICQYNITRDGQLRKVR